MGFRKLRLKSWFQELMVKYVDAIILTTFVWFIKFMMGVTQQKRF